MRKGAVVLGRRLPLKDEFFHPVPCNSFADEDLQIRLVNGKRLQASLSRRGNDEADAGGLFDPPAEAIARIYVTVLESGCGVRREKAALSSGCKSHPATAPAGSSLASSSATPAATPSRSQSHSSFAGVPLAQKGMADVLLRTPRLAANPPLDPEPPLAADPPLDP